MAIDQKSLKAFFHAPFQLLSSDTLNIKIQDLEETWNVHSLPKKTSLFN